MNDIDGEDVCVETAKKLIKVEVFSEWDFIRKVCGVKKSLGSMGESPIERRVMIKMMYEFGEKIGEEYKDDVWYVLLQVEGTDKYVLEWRESLTMELRIIGIFSLKDLIISALFINEALTEKEFSPLEDEMIEKIMG